MSRTKVIGCAGMCTLGVAWMIIGGASVEDLCDARTVALASAGSVDLVYVGGVQTMCGGGGVRREPFYGGVYGGVHGGFDGEHITAHTDLDKEWYDDVAMIERCLMLLGLLSFAGVGVEMGAPGGPPDDGSTEEVEGVRGERAEGESVRGDEVLSKPSRGDEVLSKPSILSAEDWNMLLRFPYRNIRITTPDGFRIVLSQDSGKKYPAPWKGRFKRYGANKGRKQRRVVSARIRAQAQEDSLYSTSEYLRTKTTSDAATATSGFDTMHGVQAGGNLLRRIDEGAEAPGRVAGSDVSTAASDSNVSVVGGWGINEVRPVRFKNQYWIVVNSSTKFEQIRKSAAGFLPEGKDFHEVVIYLKELSLDTLKALKMFTIVPGMLSQTDSVFKALNLPLDTTIMVHVFDGEVGDRKLEKYIDACTISAGLSEAERARILKELGFTADSSRIAGFDSNAKRIAASDQLLPKLVKLEEEIKKGMDAGSAASSSSTAAADMVTAGRRS